MNIRSKTTLSGTSIIQNAAGSPRSTTFILMFTVIHGFALITE